MPKMIRANDAVVGVDQLECSKPSIPLNYWKSAKVCQPDTQTHSSEKVWTSPGIGFPKSKNIVFTQKQKYIVSHTANQSHDRMDPCGHLEFHDRFIGCMLSEKFAFGTCVGLLWCMLDPIWVRLWLWIAQVMPNDRIISVNGVSGDAGSLSVVCQKEDFIAEPEPDHL